MRVIKPLGNEELLRLPDCASLTEKGGCTRLNIPRCMGEGCSFMSIGRADEKTNGDLWRRRLTGLPEEQQIRISKKYYGGAMPWKQNGGGM